MQNIMTFGGNTPLLLEFNRWGVRFLIVGGVAVQFYVRERVVDDLDIMIDPTLDNAEKCVHALEALGLNTNLISSSSLTQPKVQIPLKVHHYADVVTPPTDVDFAAEWDKSIASNVNGEPARVAPLELLVRLKSSSDRSNDINDVKMLLAARQP